MQKTRERHKSVRRKAQNEQSTSKLQGTGFGNFSISHWKKIGGSLFGLEKSFETKNIEKPKMGPFL